MSDVFSHPWLRGLFGDDEMAALWSARAQLRHMLAFEAAWSRNGHLAGLWSEAEGAAAAEAILGISLDMAELAAGTGRDGLAVPTLVRLLKAEAGAAVHTGSTSQDVMDSALALSIKAARLLLEARLIRLEAALADLNTRFGANPLMGRTRMQAATEITVGDRLRTWQTPIQAHQLRLCNGSVQTERIQIGGASGDRAAFRAGAEALAAKMAEDLGLNPSDTAWHAMRDTIAAFAGTLSLISGHLGKIGQDVCLMAQQGVDEIALSGGGGSSAMPHKSNPVLAELLVTLARYNASQVAGMHHAVVHEQERSGAAWALEWMILPQMAMATGRGLTAALELTAQIERMGTP